MTLSLYLSKVILTRILFAWGVLALLGLSIDLFRSATELIETGGFLAILEYISLRGPQILVTLFAVAILVGGITAFLALSNHSELIIMRASGYGVFHILLRLLPLALLLGIAFSQFGDRINSWSEAGLAAAFPDEKKPSEPDETIWARDGREIIRARLGNQDGSSLNDVTIFTTNAVGQVESRLKAKHARYENEQWVLEEIDLIEKGVAATPTSAIWNTRLVPQSVLEIATKKQNFSVDDARAALSGDAVVVRSSTYYITRIKRSYSAITLPLVMLTITALAGFGSIRGDRGVKLALYAVVLGFSYITIDGIFGSLGEIGLVEPTIAAFTPSVVFGAIGAWALLLLDE